MSDKATTAISSNIAEVPEHLANALVSIPNSKVREVIDESGGADESVDASMDDGQYNCKLDALGPIILNTDGSMGRIPNWSEFTETEKAQAIRLITARNKRRKEALLEAKRASKLAAVTEEEEENA